MMQSVSSPGAVGRRAPARRSTAAVRALFAVVFIVSLTAALPGASAASPSWGPAVRGSYLPTPDADLSLLHFTAGYRFDPVAGEPHFSAEQALPEPEGDARGYYLVQGYPPLAPDFRQFLADHGATPLRYHPQSAFIVHVDRATADALRALPEVRWVGVYQPAYRVSPLLDTSAGARREVLVQLFDDADVNLVAARLVGLGAAITTTSVTEWNLRIIAMLDGDRLAEAARTDGVDWIERWEMMYPDNHNAQWVIQTNENGNRRVWDLGLTGAGQIVSLHDTGIHTDHCMFNDPAVPITAPGDYPTHRKVIAYDLVFGTFGDNDGHGTHTSCTFAGNDESEVNTRDGMAKDARIFFTDGGVTAGGGIYTPVDLNDLFIISYTGNSAGAARITSNSWGGGGFGTYTSRSADVDEFMWNHPDYLCLFSDGNDGPTAGTVHPPSTAKDCISGGGTGNGLLAGSIYNPTSRGPTHDGRMKPTMCAPATLNSARTLTACDNITYGGTSMATPDLAGGCALIRQYCMNGWYPTGAPVLADAFTPSAAMVKALAVNSGNPNVSPADWPDNNIGWGRMLLDDVLYFAGDQRQLLLYDESPGLSTGLYDERDLYVTDNTIPLEITLVWTDYPGVPGGAIDLVNNLDLSASDGTDTWLGNNFVAEESVIGGAADDRNVEEGIMLNTPTLGHWTIRVQAASTPQGPQPYALVVTGGVSEAATSVHGDGAGLGAGQSGTAATHLMASHGPNPAAPGTIIRYRLPADGNVRISVYDVTGRAVRTLVDERQSAGQRAVAWDGRDDAGAPVPSGIYFYRIAANGEELVHKVVVSR